jgi:hypothetical protein
VTKKYCNPLSTVGIIIELGKGIVLILRRNEPRQWVILERYCEYGESLTRAAVREAKEEASNAVILDASSLASLMVCEETFFSAPSGTMTPTPVMTTLLFNSNIFKSYALFKKLCIECIVICIT